jgi:triphosphoribosyl-dephospho-CoA synthase
LKDFDNIDYSNKTNGKNIYLKHGIKGIRGEAASGFPTIQDGALPFLHSLENTDLSLNDKCVLTLIKIMSIADDTNIINRGNLDSLSYVKKKSKSILDMPLDFQIKEVYEFDKDLISKNLSPGGSADLLAATLMVYFFNN